MQTALTSGCWGAQASLHSSPPHLEEGHTHTVTLSRGKRTWEGLRRQAAVGVHCPQQDEKIPSGSLQMLELKKAT